MSAKIQKQLDHLKKVISALSDDLAKIEASVIEDPRLEELAEHQKNKINRKITALQKLYNELSIARTNSSIGFNNGQQAMVSEINLIFGNKYYRQLEVLKTMSNADKKKFFQLYAEADTDFLKETIIRSFFRRKA